MKLKYFAATILAIAVFTLPFRAVAVPVDPPQVITSIVSTTFAQQFHSGSTSDTNSLSIGVASATATANLTPSPNVTVAAAVTANGQQAIALAEIIYYFYVVGPASVQVPVIITASGGITQPLASSNVATVVFTGETLVYLESTSVSNNPSFSITASETLTPGTEYSISILLSVVANTFTSTATSDTQSGFIDPIVTIDPTFARASEFHFEFSAGVGNSPLGTTPVPGALPLFATGLGALGLLTWRKKRKAVAA